MKSLHDTFITCCIQNLNGEKTSNSLSLLLKTPWVKDHESWLITPPPKFINTVHTICKLNSDLISSICSCVVDVDCSFFISSSLSVSISLISLSKLGVGNQWRSSESDSECGEWMKRGSGELVGSPGVGLHGGSWQPPSLSLSYHTLLTFTPYHTKLYVLCIRNNPILSPILT